MTTKEWLRRARDLNRLIDAKLADRDRALELACQCTAVLSEDKVQTSHGNTSEDRMIKYVEYTREIDDLIDKLLKLKLEINTVISTVNDYRLQTVLIEYYINCKTWEQVAESMSYDKRHVTRLHGQALQKIKMPFYVPINL